MDVADQPTPEPEAPAAERLPAGVLCYQCKYDLVGRVPSEACPECGLDVAASWPAWDLRACHPAYIEHLRYEAVQMRWVAVVLVVAIGLLLAGVAALFVGASGSVVDLAAIIFVVLGVALLLFWPMFLMQLDRIVARRPRVRAAGEHGTLGPAERTRRGIRAGARTASVGMAGCVPATVLVNFWFPPIVTLLAYAALLTLCVGVAILFLNIEEARSHLFDRSGHARRFGMVATLAVLPWAMLPLGPFALDRGGVLAIVTTLGLLTALLGSAALMVWVATDALRQTSALRARAEQQSG